MSNFHDTEANFAGYEEALRPRRSYDQIERHHYEVEYICSMSTHAKRAMYLRLVEAQRGKELADKLRREVWNKIKHLQNTD